MLDRSAAADQTDDEQHDRDHEQHMNERADGVRAYDAEQPSDEQNYGSVINISCSLQHSTFASLETR